ncbi:helix-turn-helix domain containing protein [Prescottella defluvii]|nr:helix-turn-helix domain containing protein [Prescottella defluvii]
MTGSDVATAPAAFLPAAPSALVVSGLTELAAGALSGWVFAAVRRRPETMRALGVRAPQRIRQWHLDLAMLGGFTAICGTAVPAAPRVTTAALAIGAWSNAFAFLPLAFKPDLRTDRRTWAWSSDPSLRRRSGSAVSPELRTGDTARGSVAENSGMDSEAADASSTAPGPARRPDRRRARTRGAIMTAARALFAERGLQRTTIDEIAEAADVSVGAVYFHFQSKEGLYLALVDQALEVNTEAMATVDRSLPPLDRVLAAGHAYMRFALEYPEHFRMVALRVLDPVTDRRFPTSRIGSRPASRHSSGPSNRIWSRRWPTAASKRCRRARSCGSSGGPGTG